MNRPLELSQCRLGATDPSCPFTTKPAAPTRLESYIFLVDEVRPDHQVELPRLKIPHEIVHALGVPPTKATRVGRPVIAIVRFHLRVVHLRLSRETHIG